MQRIGILYNPLSKDSREFALELQFRLQTKGMHVWCGFSEEGQDTPAILDGLELMIALGGDGTALRAAWLCFPRGIPILAVAMGRLNFLTELGPGDLPQGLHLLLNGDGWYDERALLQVSLHRQGELVAEMTGLNEMVVSRGDVSRIITVDVRIDETPLTTYRSDGVVVATATGSTAYALSAGGPIVDPRSKALVLVPVAAHLTAVHSMVLHEDTVVDLVLRICYHATLSVDGRENLLLHEGDMVRVRRSDQVCRFARVRPFSQFYRRLVERLQRN
jgi:NAD+ kinase